MPAAASSHDFWQDFLRADDPVLTAPSYHAGYPARLADGRHLLLPIRVLPGDGTRAVASLITNQASFRVLDAIAGFTSIPGRSPCSPAAASCWSTTC
jgi:hypothetical protein